MGDALSFDFDQLTQQKPFTLVSNLPYEISTPMIFKLAQHVSQLECFVLLLQQEVVSRMCATVGSSQYGRLSVMTQYYFECEALIEVGPECFSPPPKVMSQVVRCRPRAHREQLDEAALSAFVKDLFAHRRKMIRQVFKHQITSDGWEQLGIDASLRPQSLDLSMIIQLFNYCH